MQKLKIIITIVIVTLLFSCTKIYELDTKIEKKINVSCLLYSNEEVRVNLSFTFISEQQDDYEAIFTESGHIFFQSNNYITNAEVFLYENNNFIGQLNYDSLIDYKGWYLLEDFYPQEDMDYQLKVVVPEYDTVYAETHIPIASRIDTIKQLSLDFDIIINISKQNNIKSYYTLDCFDNLDFYTIVTYSSNDPIFENRNNIGQFIYDDYYLYYSLFSDSLFINNKYTLNLDLTPNNTHNYFRLNTLSSDAYFFYKTSYLQNKFMTNPLVMPVQVYSNIQNGSGIFAGISYFTDTLELNFY